MIDYLDNHLFDFDKWMLYYDRIDFSEESDVAKSNNNKEYTMIF